MRKLLPAAGLLAALAAMWYARSPSEVKVPLPNSPEYFNFKPRQLATAPYLGGPTAKNASDSTMGYVPVVTELERRFGRNYVLFLEETVNRAIEHHDNKQVIEQIVLNALPVASGFTSEVKTADDLKRHLGEASYDIYDKGGSRLHGPAFYVIAGRQFFGTRDNPREAELVRRTYDELERMMEEDPKSVESHLIYSTLGRTREGDASLARGSINTALALLSNQNNPPYEHERGRNLALNAAVLAPFVDYESTRMLDDAVRAIADLADRHRLFGDRANAHMLAQVGMDIQKQVKRKTGFSQDRYTEQRLHEIAGRTSR